MRSAIETLMVLEDERQFLEFVLQRPSVVLIPDSRFSNPEVPHTRAIENSDATQYFLWDKELLINPAVREFAHEGKSGYLLDCGDSVLQFLRSVMSNSTLAPGRVAIATEPKHDLPKNAEQAGKVAEWYKSLRSWIKKRYTNNLVFTSDYKPDVGDRVRDIWVGPNTIKAYNEGLRLKPNGSHRFSYHPFDISDEPKVLSGLRRFNRLMLSGTIISSGEMAGSRMTLGVDFDANSHVSQYVGAFSVSRPEPKVGDRVACIFTENLHGDAGGPWKPNEAKKLLPKSQQKTLQSLRKNWRVNTE